MENWKYYSGIPNSLDSDLYLLQYLLLIANTANKIVSFYVFIDVIVSLRKYRKFKEDRSYCPFLSTFSLFICVRIKFFIVYKVHVDARTILCSYAVQFREEFSKIQWSSMYKLSQSLAMKSLIYQDAVRFIIIADDSIKNRLESCLLHVTLSPVNGTSKHFDLLLTYSHSLSTYRGLLDSHTLQIEIFTITNFYIRKITDLKVFWFYVARVVG